MHESQEFPHKSLGLQNKFDIQFHIQKNIIQTERGLIITVEFQKFFLIWLHEQWLRDKTNLPQVQTVQICSNDHILPWMLAIGPSFKEKKTKRKDNVI